MPCAKRYLNRAATAKVTTGLTASSGPVDDEVLSAGRRSGVEFGCVEEGEVIREERGFASVRIREPRAKSSLKHRVLLACGFAKCVRKGSCMKLGMWYG